MFEAIVTVGNKRGVEDPEGKNITKTLQLLGYDGVNDVRSAKMYKIYIDAPSVDDAKKKVEDMCRKLLSNPVIHEYAIDIHEIPGE